MIQFKKKVLAVVSGIPKGAIMTYQEVAARAGSPNASRAVGNIMRENYDSSVPCHRVVRTDGCIGNYNRGGTERKKQLLMSEGVKIVGDRIVSLL